MKVGEISLAGRCRVLVKTLPTSILKLSHRLLRVFLSFVIASVTLTAPGFISTANAVVCTAAGSNVSLSALHRVSTDAWGTYRPFYADIKGGVSGKNSNYIGYAIDGSAVSGVSDLWIKLSSFTAASGGAKIALASNQAAAIPVRDSFKNSGGTDDATKRVAYFYLTTNYSGNDYAIDQTFTIQLFNGNPNLNGQEICNATDGFSDIIDTLSANANKVTSVTPSTTTAVIGSNFSVTALGQTGTMGAGDPIDRVSGYGPFIISPSILDSWDANAFNLVGVSYLIDSNNNGFLTDDTATYNSLRYYPQFTSNRKYQVIYYFAAREVASSTSFAPVQNIASGTQVKYTGSYSGTASNTSISIVKSALSLNKSLKSITSAGTSGSNSLYDLSYRITIKNLSSVTSKFDYVQDQVTLNTATTGGTFVSPTNGATVTLDTSTSISPTTIASIAGSVLTLNFNGPMTLTSGQTSNIDYTVRVSYPTANTSMPINNTATGYIGTDTITASAGVNAVSVNIKTTYTLQIDFATSGYVTVDASQVNGSSCSSQSLTSGSVTCTFYKGTPLTLTAVSASAAISSWGSTANGSASNTGDCATSNANSPCTLVIQANSVITPLFNTSYTVTVTGVSNVLVSDGGTAYTCSSGTCTKSYADGSTPSLTFTPDTGYTISSITSNAASPSTATFPNTSSGSLLVKSNFTITVTASLPQYGLDVAATSGGLVSSTGSYITSCSSDANGATGTCGALINSGTSVTLTATVSSGYYFGGWSGDGTCTGTTLTCTFSMTQNRSVAATFTSSPSLVVTVVGTGSVSASTGSITGCDSSGVNCSGSYTLNSTETLTATIPTGYSLTWSGACSGSASTCGVLMNASKAVTATFTAINYTITIASVTGGSGTSSAATVTYNGSVTLTTTASSGYTFTSWSCTVGTLANSASSSTTLSAITANTTCTPTFTITYTVTIGTLTNGTGSSISIATSPSIAGETITLTIAPASGNQLKSGTLSATPDSGSTPTISGSSNTYTFTMPASNVTITAEFEAVAAGTYTITINSATGGSGSSSAATVSSGGSVTLTATASSGYSFSSWSCTGGGALSSSTANPATLSNITANATCTPVFTQNATNSRGGGGGGIGRSGNKIVVAKVINTQPTSVNSGSKPVFTGTSTTLTPGNSANKTSTILPAAATATSKSGGIIAVVTNTSAIPAPINANASATSQGVAAITASSTTTITELEKRSDLSTSVNVERNGENGIQVSANNGWTGRVSVSVINGNSDENVETFVEVVITPTPVIAPKIVQEEPPAIQKPEEKPKPGLVINWAPSQSEVVGYVVTVNSQPICFSMSTSCEITQLIGPKTKVAVIAQGNDNTFSTPVPLPAFKPTKPIPALVVNFAVASSVLSPKFKADLRDLAKVMVKEGFTKVDIAGHTDSTGQAVSYDNQKLSDARAKATLTYLKRFVPKLKSVTGAYAYERRITDESTPEALYTNRRAEVAVS